MLLCPWLLSLLYNSLRPIFLRTRFTIAFLYVRRFIEPRQHCAFVDLNKVQWWWWRKSWGRNPPEYQINVLQKTVFKEKQTKAVVYIVIQASASQYWITRELLWCFCMQHMIYYCTFCGTIRASEDKRAVRETLLSKLKQLLFRFFSINQLFQNDETDSFAGYFLPAVTGNMTFYHCDTLTHSFSHLYSKKKQTHTTRSRKLFIHTVYINLYCVSRCAQYFTRA